MNVYDMEVNGLTLRFQLSSEDAKRFKGAKKVDPELERIEREAAKTDEVPVIEDGAETVEGAKGEDPEAPDVKAKPAGKTGK